MWLTALLAANQAPDTVPSPPRGDLVVVLVSLGLAVIAAVWAQVGKGDSRPATWDSSSPWVTTLTAVVAVVLPILQANILPKTPSLLTTTGYTILPLFFGALVAVAPVFYSAIAPVVQTDDGTTPPGQWRAAFFGASLLTIWAIFGELLLASFIMWELQHDGDISSAVAWIFIAVFAIVGLLLFTYAQAKVATAKASLRAARAAPMLRDNVTASPAPTKKPDMLRWPLW